MFRRTHIAPQLLPVILPVALLLALAPMCTMPACAPMMGLAGMVEHGHGCQDYMMVDDEPDGLPTAQPPALAMVAVTLLPAGFEAPVAPEVPVCAALTPEYDPLGVRIRI